MNTDVIVLEEVWNKKWQPNCRNPSMEGLASPHGIMYILYAGAEVWLHSPKMCHSLSHLISELKGQEKTWCKCLPHDVQLATHNMHSELPWKHMNNIRFSSMRWVWKTLRVMFYSWILSRHLSIHNWTSLMANQDMIWSWKEPTVHKIFLPGVKR